MIRKITWKNNYLKKNLSKCKLKNKKTKKLRIPKNNYRYFEVHIQNWKIITKFNKKNFVHIIIIKPKNIK